MPHTNTTQKASAQPENMRTDKSEIAAVTRYFNKSVAASASKYPRRIQIGSVYGVIVDENGSYVSEETKDEIARRYNNAERLAEACKGLIARLDYAHNKIVWNTKDHEAIEKGLLALAEYEGRSKDQ